MAVLVVCPECHTSIKARASDGGRKVRCPECCKVVVIPGPAHKDGDDEEDEAHPRPNALPYVLASVAAAVVTGGLGFVAGMAFGGRQTVPPQLPPAQVATITPQQPQQRFENPHDLAKEFAPPPLRAPAKEASPPPPPTKSKSVDWRAVPSSVEGGSLAIGLTEVRRWDLDTHVMERGGLRNLGEMTRITVRVVNKSPTKTLRFKGWANDTTSLADEHGNSYRLLPLQKGLRLYDPVGQGYFEVDGGGERVIHPMKSADVVLYFEAMPPQAMEARLTVSAKATDGDGVIYLRSGTPKRK